MPDSSSARKADPQENLHHGPLSGGIGWGSAFRAGLPDSSSKSGSPRQPAPIQEGLAGDPLYAGFQLEKRIPKTTFITAPFQEGLAGDLLFELECRIPGSKSGSPTQPSSRPPFRRDWLGIRFSSCNAGFQLEKPRQPSSRPPFRRDWLGIRFSSWNAGFQLEKRIPKTTFITAPFQEGLAGDPLFELECRIPARKAKTTFITAPFQEGLAGDPLFELECRIPARKADPQNNPHHGPPFRRDWLGIRFSSWNAGFQLEKRIPKTTFITAPLSGGIGWGSAFRAGMPDSSSKSGSPRQPPSRPPFRRDWLGIRFSSWNAGFQFEKRIPKTAFITAPFQEQGTPGSPQTRSRTGPGPNRPGPARNVFVA